jgi:hypothetical protein
VAIATLQLVEARWERAKPSRKFGSLVVALVNMFVYVAVLIIEVSAQFRCCVSREIFYKRDDRREAVELPTHDEIERALWRILLARNNKHLTAQEAYRLLAEHFTLSSSQMSATLKSRKGSENKWHNRCRTARNHLVKRNVLNRLPKDSWSLTASALRLPGPDATAEQLGL